MGSAASFYWPVGITVDSNGTVYAADFANNRIRKISPSGAVSTLAGSGNTAYADGEGGEASFYYPNGVAVDSEGNVYVAELVNNRIRKISPSGTVSTLAGSGNAAYADGEGVEASFYYPTGVAVDNGGTVFVADKYNHRIRMISASGHVTTFAGSGNAGYSDGEGLEASFSYPSGVSVDSHGTVYIADSQNNRIRKFAYSSSTNTITSSSIISSSTSTSTESTSTVYASISVCFII